MPRLLTIALACALVLAAAQVAPAVTAARVACTTSATAVFANTADNLSRRVLVRNPTANSVYLGGSTVASGTGFELAAGDAMSTVLEGGDTLYCISASGSNTVHTFVSRY